MASITLQAAGNAIPQSCNSNVLSIERQRPWTASSGGHLHTRDVAPEQLLVGDVRLVTGSCVPSKLHAGEKGSGSIAVHSQREREEILWREFFLDPTLWWDNRQDKKTSRSPDFRHKESKQVLWLNSVHKPAWVDAQLVRWDEETGFRIRPPAPTFNWPSHDSPYRRAEDHEGDVTVEACSQLCETGLVSEAVDALGVLVQTGSRVSTSLFYIVLKECLAKKDLVLGRRVHALAVKGGYQSNTFLANHFLRMYTSHGRLEEATLVFDCMSKPDAFTLSAIISAHAEHGDPKQAIQLYRMRSSGVKLDSHVFVAALKACSVATDLESGREVHADVLKTGLQSDVFVSSSLVDMYAKCGSLEDGRRVFDNLSTRNVVTWNSMINAYAEWGLGHEALALYARTEQEGIVANSVTFACLLRACANVGALQQGKQLHSQILERGLLADVVVGSCLVDMYGQCGSLEDARRVFDNLPAKNVVTWNTMLNRYTEHGLGQEALTLYATMEGSGMILADKVTFAVLLKACAGIGGIQQGKQLHSQILERGLAVDVIVGNSLVDMYVKCGGLDHARQVFDDLPARDVVTWTTMIAGYAGHGLGQESLALYAEMEKEGLIAADSVTFACLLKACQSIGALQQGRQLHDQIVERGLETDPVVGNCLVDMYAKCGRLEDARRVFHSLPKKDVITWNIMLSGLGESNEGRQAIQCFHEMLGDGVQPNGITFICLLTACSHEGLVDEGRRHFQSMVEDHGIEPTRQHYMCMVDLLGRSGHLHDAEKLLLSMPFKKDAVGWTSLLYACKTHGDMECGGRCFDILTELDAQDASAYVLMANIYADAGRWADVKNIEQRRKSVGAFKKPAEAGIEVDRKVHKFIVGEKEGISSKLRRMNERLKADGSHMPHTDLVLKPISEKEKENELCGHAEKLALAYGLLNTPDGTPLLVTKNLRMCGDCHSATQVMSRVEKREIVVRDAHRVHRFVEGSCCCSNRP